MISLWTCWVPNRSGTLELSWTRAGDLKGELFRKGQTDVRIAYVELDSVELLNKALSVSYCVSEGDCS